MANAPVQRMSKLMAKTLRDDPADAEVLSHKLLVRAGYVRRTAAGLWSWLPLGKKVLGNIERIVREEMDAIGAQEVQLPALLPREPYEATGRWQEYGPELFRLQDRKGGDYLLGPTHEEIFTLLVKDQASSYKDLPVILYQIQNKYRDEARPRAGILRGREFLMKDSYSFDVADEGLAESYALHRAAYQRIFERLGLDYRIVAATAGAMGGSKSEEFLAPAEAGEDTFADCPNCDYAANTEAITFRLTPVDATDVPAAEDIPTPDTPTIETLAASLGVEASATLKNLLVKVDGEIVAVGVPGDREVDMDKVEAHFAPAAVELVTAEDFVGRPDLVRGYVGPQGLGEKVTYIADPRVAPGTAWITGANKADTHAKNVVAGRDFEVDTYVDVVVVREGDPCPNCGTGLKLDRAIEIGHIFQLGRKYADALKLDVLGQNGKPARVTMGSYGIGVSRAVAALAEQHADDKGLVWSKEVAPADVHVVAAGKALQTELALEVSDKLAAAGVRVLVDDRAGVSPGVKFTDAELIGVPQILVAGRRSGEGVVELKDRRTGEREEVTVEEALTRLTS
ncbi:proline--tRNA ligase [Streptomyces violaceoruber]|uniref:Proline--tRNA ligase n=9 Tax=Streptomyces TaxID=1883 RepID=SYP_STRCO|nr:MULTISPECIES: proline--tRNA ligase [Streptomyces]Q9KYR6.1 RecName: Full=Proline--tRNA ligase; AltName: Full=Prolyl-tRNA synthetase; Short=ProRS [Streptomyces coelicolor A3(2)]QSJ08544.1 Proline-tRNA ligase [Streptomyces lividans]AIJ13026.1 Proline-tRNA ligase [Streptomyces lividans TK24]EFD66396.1 prolyl-tRNA synthetase [Streptomyces lividans TK24]EOY50667.1 Prolyl-tRNA synthetase, bacterial type [Streptomyces lividans 1326]KKD10347.1 prolyl-tRNA synthetase [Streptomyces sp. WM6391]